MTPLANSLSNSALPDRLIRRDLSGPPAAQAPAFAQETSLVLKNSLKVSDEARTAAAASGLADAVSRAQKLMDYTHPPEPTVSVPASTAGAAADDSASQFGSERQAQEQRLRALALMRLLEQSGASDARTLKSAEKGAEFTRAVMADKSYRAMQNLDSEHREAMARARQLGLHISVLA